MPLTGWSSDLPQGEREPLQHLAFLRFLQPEVFSMPQCHCGGVGDSEMPPTEVYPFQLPRIGQRVQWGGGLGDAGEKSPGALPGAACRLQNALWCLADTAQILGPEGW